MKTRFLIATAAALALSACGSHTMNTTSDDSNVVGVDNMAGPDANLAEANMAADNGAVAAAPLDTRTFVNTAAASDAFEIASAKAVEGKLKSADLKAFAAKMIAQHTQSTAELKAAAPAAPEPTMSAKQQADLTALKAATADSVDQLYTTQQLAAHQEALAAMQGYAASGDDVKVKAFASKTAPVVQQHLDMLQKM